MRSRTSSAQTRLRSGGYKCNLCGRRVIDAPTLERHQKTVHNVPSKGKKVGFKVKPPVHKTKLSSSIKVAAFEDLVREEILAEAKPKAKTKNEEIRVRIQEEILAESTTKQKKDVVASKNDDSSKIENVDNDKKSSNNKKGKYGKRRVEFECPVCEKTFNIYFTAHRHIQNFHPINAEGKKVAPNSLDLIQPIRVEQCVKCTSRIKSTELHICQSSNPEDSVEIASQFICSGCYQSFISLKTFDMHVAGLHSDGVDSMFFPTDVEFNNWRLEMERQTNMKYVVLGEYDSKKIYRCNYARENDLNDISTSHFCPSTMVVQDFSKGIQVHFYKKHYGHQAQAYLLANKYKKYSITSFLKNPDMSTTNAAITNTKLENRDLYTQFKTLMESIILDAKQVDSSRLKQLTEKALQMTALLTNDECTNVIPKLNKNMSDKEITNALESKHTIRRRSMDAIKTYPSPAKRLRNKSVFVQSENNSSPKILNSFSLASNCNEETSDPLKIKIEVFKSSKNSIIENPDTTNKTKGCNRATRFSQSPSFNDSYKDFVDKTIKATIAADKTTKSRDRSRVNTAKSKTVKVSPKATDEVKSQYETCNIKILTPPKKLNNSITIGSTELTSNLCTPKFDTTKSPSKVEVYIQENMPRTATPPSVRKIKADFEYEVREQENDCNILILKI